MRISTELEAFFSAAAKLLPQALPDWEPGKLTGLMEALEAALPRAREDKLRQELKNVLRELRTYFRSSSSVAGENDGQAWIELAPDGSKAYLTLLPARRGGRTVGSEDVFKLLDIHQVSFGVDSAAVRSAVAYLQSSGDVVYAVPVARGAAPGAGRDARLELTVPVLDKDKLDLTTAWLKRELPQHLRQVIAGEKIGLYYPMLLGEPGRSVKGKVLPGLPGKELPCKLGASLKLAPNGAAVVATSSGQLVRDGGELSVIPCFVAEADYGPSQPQIDFRGDVIILGNLSGQRVEAEGVLVAGNCERVTIHAAGDVLVGGSILGKKETGVIADGRIIAYAVSDARLEALGEVLVSHIIIYSEVASNARVVVKGAGGGAKGAIIGGTVAALQGVEARVIGSDFGTFTRVISGKDFLTPKRLQAIQERIKFHEENLRKIAELKARLSKANIDIRKLPPEKQDLYLNVLRKEELSKRELERLSRRAGKFSRALTSFLSASIRVLEELYPPVEVQIGETIKEIQERLKQVVIKRDEQQGLDFSFGE